MTIASRFSPSPIRARVWALILGAVTLTAVSCSDLATEPEVEPIVEEPETVRPSADVASIVVPQQLVGCPDEPTMGPHGALWQVCVPPEWNGGVVFYAHGYVAPDADLAVPEDELGGQAVSDVVLGLGFVYAATSYPGNGLVAADAVDDLEALAGFVDEEYPIFAEGAKYLVGPSEGGLATALAMQSSGTPFDGALAFCGPVGDFQRQINHFGDFRLVFDYFFRGVLPGDPFAPDDLAALRGGWESRVQDDIRGAIADDLATGGHRTRQLYRVTRTPTGPDPGQTAVDVLWYNVFATTDAADKLGGLPFDNRRRWYWGSDNDFLLNWRIPRFSGKADQGELARYETTGEIARPAVTLHTTGDPIVPYWHEPRYKWKAWGRGDGWRLTTLPSYRYGHCQFTLPEALTAFSLLVWKVSVRQLLVSSSLFSDRAHEAEFLELAREQGTSPRIVERFVPRF